MLSIHPIRNTMCERKQISACFVVFLKVNGQEQEQYNLKSLTTFYVPFFLMKNLKGLPNQQR